MKQTQMVMFQADGIRSKHPVMSLEERGGSDGPDRPLVLFPRSQASRFDCDCACNLDLPTVLSERVAQLFDCDCACALDLYQSSAMPSASALWVKHPQAVSFPFETEWQAYLNPSGPVGVAVLNAGAERVLATFNAPIPIADATAHLPGISPRAFQETVKSLAGTGLLSPAPAEGLSLLQPSVLSAWLTITEACNLSCPYCYVHKQPATMSAHVGELAVDRLVETAMRHGYSALKLKYAGGEPTLAFPSVQAIHAYAAQSCAEVGLALEEVILTNGVGVTDEMLDCLAREGMRLMVSLDGGPEAHDRVRGKRGGASTYASVSGTVERAIERGLRPSISITLTELSLDGVGEAVAFALQRQLPFNLNFYRECSSTGLGAGTSPLTPRPERLLETMKGVFELIGRYPAYPLALGAILDRTRLDVPHHHTCSAGRDYLVVDSQGRVSACQMLMDVPWTDLEEEDPLDTIRRRGMDLFTPVEDQGECGQCPWRMACSGGCPLMRGSALHDDYCRVYRTLLPELVRLEAKRLVARQSVH
jgi:uncharacterized protein